MDKLFSSNIEDKEVLFKRTVDTEGVRDNPPKSEISTLNGSETCQTDRIL